MSRRSEPGPPEAATGSADGTAASWRAVLFLQSLAHDLRSPLGVVIEALASSSAPISRPS